MDTGVGAAPGPVRSGRRPGWRALARVLWAPRRTVAEANGNGWVLPPYLLGMACSLLVWYLVVQLLPDLNQPPAPAGPEGPGDIMWGPMGPGPQPLPLDQLRAALRPEFLAVAAVAAPWFGGLWRGLVVHIGAALAGVRLPFSRSFGLAGYAMLPLFLGQLLAALLTVVLTVTSPVPLGGGSTPGGGMGPGDMPIMEPGMGGKSAVIRSAGAVRMVGPAMPGPEGPRGPEMGGGAGRPSFSQVPVKWTLDRLAPEMKPGLWQRLLAGLDFFHLWHLLLLGLVLAALTRRVGQPVWAAVIILGSWLLLAALQPQMTQVLTWIGLLR